MSRWFRTFLAMFVIALVALSTIGFATTALGAPPAQQKASISLDARACTITGTFTFGEDDGVVAGGSYRIGGFVYEDDTWGGLAYSRTGTLRCR